VVPSDYATNNISINLNRACTRSAESLYCPPTAHIKVFVPNLLNQVII
jgi:hypothetical protein